MNRVVAIMNTKGGVGKSTLTMMLAETLASIDNIGMRSPKILVIDADSQASISNMLLPTSEWQKLEKTQKTFFEYMINAIKKRGKVDLDNYVKHAVSDVTGAQSISLLPSRIELALLERELMLTPGNAMKAIRQRIAELIAQARAAYDLVLIDCAPGYSVLTEALLREADLFLPPVKPDYLSARGLGVLQTLSSNTHKRGDQFAVNMGVLINNKGPGNDPQIWTRKLKDEPSNKTFPYEITQNVTIAAAAQCMPDMRGFGGKYPGVAGTTIKRIAKEFWARLN